MYSVDETLRNLAEKVIEENPNLAHLKTPDITILYMYSDKQKKRAGCPVYADTEKVSSKMRSLAGCDFIITFYKPNSDRLTPEQMEILMYHELRHVGYDPEKEKRYIIPHDVQDFADIIEEHGVYWTD